MKNIFFLFLLLISFKVLADNSLVDLIDKSKHDQIFCGKQLSKKENQYIKNNMAYALDYCISDQSLQRQYKDDFEQLLNQAEKNSKEYGFYVATAYMSGLGVEPNIKIAGDWMLKSSKAGNEKATYAYYIFELEGGSGACNQNENSCIEEIYQKLREINTAKSYEILSSYAYAFDLEKKCQYIKKAVKLGSVDAYPAYVTCYQDLEKMPMTKQMRERLNQIFSDRTTSIYTKAAAADLLGKKKVADLLYRAVQ